MDINDWITYHDNKCNKRTLNAEGRERFHPMSSVPGQQLFVDPERGAFQYFIDQQNNIAYITGVVGDVRFLQEKFSEIAKNNGVTRIIAYTCLDNPKPLARLIGYKVTRTWYELEQVIEDKPKDGGL